MTKVEGKGKELQGFLYCECPKCAHSIIIRPLFGNFARCSQCNADGFNIKMAVRTALSTDTVKGIDARIIDFTKSFWGHALHATTWREVRRRPRLLNLLLRRDDMIRHYEVCCHTDPAPVVGQLIKYKGKGSEGPTTYARIIGVRGMRNPNDMYELKLEITPELRAMAAGD